MNNSARLCIVVVTDDINKVENIRVLDRRTCEKLQGVDSEMENYI